MQTYDPKESNGSRDFTDSLVLEVQELNDRLYNLMHNISDDDDLRRTQYRSYERLLQKRKGLIVALAEAIEQELEIMNRIEND